MPGTEFVTALDINVQTTPDLLAFPELPDRGAGSSMIGRALGLLDSIGADISEGSWRMIDRPGRDQVRARNTLNNDCELIEEHLQGFDRTVKFQVTGPLTLAAAVNLARGERVLADHGAMRELSESLAVGVALFVAKLRRAVPAAEVIVQLDEPSLMAVLEGRIETSSKFSRYRAIAPAFAAELLAMQSADVVHSCAANIPINLLRESGFRAVSFDLSLNPPSDDFAEALEAGVALWPGVIVPGKWLSSEQYADQVRHFFSRLGFDTVDESTVLTPSCGLAGYDQDVAVKALRTAQQTVAAIA